jgi:Phage capsid family
MKKTNIRFGLLPKLNGRNCRNKFTDYRSNAKTPEELKAVELKAENDFKESIKELSAENQIIANANYASIKNIRKEFEAQMISETEANEAAMKLVTDSNEELKALTAKLKDGLHAVATKQKGYGSGGDSFNSNTKLVEEDLSMIKDSLAKGAKEVTIKANYTRSSVANSTQAMRLDSIGQLATRRLNIYDLFNKIPVEPESNGVVRYTDWDATTIARSAAMVSEGGTFLESTAAFAEYTLNLQKIGDTLPISEEVLLYTNRFEAELERFLRVNVSVVQDTQLLTGSGTAPNLKGIYTSAGTYTAVGSGITDASIYDLIVKMGESITVASGSKYLPNFALMNISDINKMKLKKDANKNYVMPPFVTTGGQIVDGVTIIEANGLAANTMVLGDRNFADIYEASGYIVSAMPSGTQFAADLTTLKVKKHMALLIRKADETGFVKCTSISTALTTLAT